MPITVICETLSQGNVQVSLPDDTTIKDVHAVVKQEAKKQLKDEKISEDRRTFLEGVAEGDFYVNLSSFTPTGIRSSTEMLEFEENRDRPLSHYAAPNSEIKLNLITTDPQLQNHLDDIVKTCIATKHLDLHHSFETDPDPQKTYDNLSTRLKSMDVKQLTSIRVVDPAKIKFEELKDLITRAEKLTEFKLDNQPHLTTGQMGELLALLSKRPLQSLSLTNMQFEPDERPHPYNLSAKELSKIEKEERLCISRNMDIINQIMLSPSIREVNLSGNHLGKHPESLHFIAGALAKSSKVTSLNLSENDIDAKGIAPVTHALQTTPSELIMLNLSTNRLGDEGSDLLAKVLESSTAKIETLNLAKNQISYIHLIAKVTAEKKDCTLRSLNIARNQLFDGGLIELAESLKVKGNPLSDLNIAYNQNVSKEGLEAFLGYLKDNKALTSLNVGQSISFKSPVNRAVCAAVDSGNFPNSTLVNFVVEYDGLESTTARKMLTDQLAKNNAVSSRWAAAALHVSGQRASKDLGSSITPIMSSIFKLAGLDKAAIEHSNKYPHTKHFKTETEKENKKEETPQDKGSSAPGLGRKSNN